MMKRKIRITVSWLLVIACASVIFLLSAQKGAASAELSNGILVAFGQMLMRLFGEEAAHTVLRKGAHFTLYCMLMFLTYHACFCTRKQKRLHFVLPFVLCVLYAIGDEIHQYFVPERACRIFDIGVDALGCIVGGLCFFLLAKLCLYIRKKKNEEAFL